MKEYLGDSVYAESDNSGGIVLTTENDSSGPSNTIYMEPQVFKALMLFQVRIQTKRLEDNSYPGSPT